MAKPSTGAGWDRPTNGTWATMISPDYFVSAAHYHPAGGDTLTFFEGNDPSGPSHQFTVASWSFQTSYNGVPSDLWLGKLTEPIPASDHITYYPVLGLPSDNDYVGQMIYVNGKPNRVGRNIIDRITTAQEPDAERYKDTVSMEFDYNTVSGLGADECYLIGGDSGGPSFVDVNGQLALVGIHYYNGGTPGPVDLVPSPATRSCPTTSTNSMQTWAARALLVVPEPSTFVLLLAALLPVASLFAAHVQR